MSLGKELGHLVTRTLSIFLIFIFSYGIWKVISFFVIKATKYPLEKMFFWSALDCKMLDDFEKTMVKKTLFFIFPIFGK